MKFEVVSSGSKGNGYIISDSKNNVIVLELGCSDYPLTSSMNIELGLYTHYHNDHFPTLRSHRGFKFKNFLQTLCEVKKLEANTSFETESFYIKAFPMMHTNNDGSSADCVSYFIHSKIDNKNLFFATDFYYNEKVRYNYENMFNFLLNEQIDIYAIECNFNNKYYNYIKEINEHFKNYESSTRNHLGSSNFILFFNEIYRGKIVPCYLIHSSYRFFYGYRNFLKLNGNHEIIPTVELLNKKFPKVLFTVAKSIY